MDQVNTRVDKAAEKQLVQDVRQAATDGAKQHKAAQKKQKASKKVQQQRKKPGLIIISKVALPEQDVVITGSSRSRSVRRPKRYDN